MGRRMVPESEIPSWVWEERTKLELWVGLTRFLTNGIVALATEGSPLESFRVYGPPRPGSPSPSGFLYRFLLGEDLSRPSYVSAEPRGPFLHPVVGQRVRLGDHWVALRYFTLLTELFPGCWWSVPVGDPITLPVRCMVGAVPVACLMGFDS